MDTSLAVNAPSPAAVRVEALLGELSTVIQELVQENADREWSGERLAIRLN
jgi:hypothetical protein